MTAQMEKVLEVKDVNVRYGSLRVLEGVSFEVLKGDVVGVVGPNGGGKTTLVNAVLGILPIESGTIRLFGEDIRTFTQFHRIGYVAQNAIQFDPIFPATVEEIVSLGCISKGRLGRRLRKEDKDNIRHALELVDLYDLRKRKIGQLSGGQKQRIFLAKALVKRPDLLILDEATVGLDICIEDRFIDMVRRMKEERDVTVITVSHDLSGVMCQANKLAVVNRKIYFQEIRGGEDPTKALRQAYGEHFTFLFHHDHSTCGISPIDLAEEEMK
ncbi:MAG: metal ABC transporter ATP-binding protein [Methanomassiliicoccales archaeon]|nr:MAG: metal ABC transporter ATP-binding protein [Methanomassiliicoccales archaeon]